jgi:hypothetical protein
LGIENRQPALEELRMSLQPGQTHRTRIRLMVEHLEARNLLANSALVYPGPDGNLIYQPDARDNHIEDFSMVGYQTGLVPLPDTAGGVTVPIQASLDPSSGDQTARIQAAIDQVSQLPPDSNGFRGAVLLTAGEYPINGQLHINASGVVLEGVGADPVNGTRLRATGTSQRTLIQVSGSGSRMTVSGTTHNLVDNYVPVGTTSFNVDSTANLHVGDLVEVHRPSPANWIHDIGMDLLQYPWQPNSKNIDWDRTITNIDGNTITVDAPLTNSLEQQYGGGTIHRYTWSGRLNNVGIENLYGFSDYNGSTDENHSWTLIDIKSTTNAFVHDVTSQYFAFACVEVEHGAKWVTVQDCQCLDPISQITGGRRYSFDIGDGAELSLFLRDYARKGRHDFTIQSLMAGPNAFVNCYSDQAYAESGPHQRWSTGTLFDNVETHGNSGSGINIRKAGNEGTGHGWQGANYVIWNSTADRMNISSPPTAQNWVIGPRANTYSGNAIYESKGMPVDPQSLYYQQLSERQANPAIDRRQYRLGDNDNFHPGDDADYPYVDPDWYAAVQNRAGSVPIVGFDDLRTAHKWVPFTFTFNLAPGEQVIDATLNLGLRRTGSVVEDDRIYLNDLNNSYRFDELGWTPLPTNTGAGRVLDLGSHMDISQLLSGFLNVAIQDDTAVSWAELDLQVINTGAGANLPAGLALATALSNLPMGQTDVNQVMIPGSDSSLPDNLGQDYLAAMSSASALDSAAGPVSVPTASLGTATSAVPVGPGDGSHPTDLGTGLVNADMGM